MWKEIGKDKEIIEGSSGTPGISNAFKAIADHNAHCTFLIDFVLLYRLITDLWQALSNLHVLRGHPVLPLLQKQQLYSAYQVKPTVYRR